MSSTPVASSHGVLASTPSAQPPRRRLDSIANGCRVAVVAVDGDDDLSHRLLCVGMWPGAVLERIAKAPFGGPLLFRLHGYRLALRRSEAERVLVLECDG